MSTYTPGELAAEWNCSVDQVLSLIHGKHLAAFSVSAPGSKRPHYRIDAADVEAFKVRQQSLVPVVRSRRRKATADYPRFV